MNATDILTRTRPDADCLVWCGGVSGSGYGGVRINGRNTTPHRALWEHSIGPIPPGKQIDHLCRERLCVNLAHMEIVTPAENTRRQPRCVNRTTCRHRHPLQGDNLYVSPDGIRACKTCRRAAGRRHDAKRRAKPCLQ